MAGAGTVNAWGFAGLFASVFLICLIGVVVIGAHVVSKYPSTYDPARNARRFTIPVVIMAAVALVTLAGALVAVGVAITTP